MSDSSETTAEKVTALLAMPHVVERLCACGEDFSNLYCVVEICEEQKSIVSLLSQDDLQKAVQRATGWSREGEEDLLGMASIPNVLRVLMIDNEGWETLYITVPGRSPNAPGGTA